MNQLKCPACNRALQFRDDLAGEQVQCPACDEVFGIPRTVESSQPLATSAVFAQPPAQAPQFPTTLPIPLRRRRRNVLAIIVGVVCVASAVITIGIYSHNQGSGEKDQGEKDQGEKDQAVISLLDSGDMKDGDKVEAKDNRRVVVGDNIAQPRPIQSDRLRAYVFASKGSDALLKKGAADEAIAFCDEAIRLNPESALAFRIRGLAFLTKGEGDRGIADLDTAIRLDPKDVKAYVSRAGAYLDKGDFDRTIADASEAIRLDPACAEAYYNRGGAYLNKANYDRAIADSSEAIRLKPKLAWAYYNRGLAYQQTGDRVRAHADFNRAVELDPNVGK